MAPYEEQSQVPVLIVYVEVAKGSEEFRANLSNDTGARKRLLYGVF